MNKHILLAALCGAAVAGATGYWLGHASHPATQEAPAMAGMPAPSAGADDDRILYYRNPMGLADTSPVPKNDVMGMAYIPVHAKEAQDAGTVKISPGRLQTLGVRTAMAESHPVLARSVRATGVVKFDERRLAAVTTRAEGWIEKLEVAASGESVRRGQVLAWVYAPDLTAAEQEYLVAAGLNQSGHAAHDGGDALVEASVQRLRSLGVPADEIERLRRTGQASRRIAVRAPEDGIVAEKMAIEGMRVAAGDPLYRLADLSSMWMIADVQESELGLIRPGQAVKATFAAFPGRTFEGSVDFIYPMLASDTRTARIRIVMPNRDLALRAEMFASATIETSAASSAETVLTVPDSAVIDSGVRQVVLIKKGEGRFAPQVVKVGARGDGTIQILDGLAEGEIVVTSANFLIDAESNLKSALQAFAADGKEEAK